MVSIENHTRGIVFEKQKSSHLSAIKCLFWAFEVIGISLLPLFFMDVFIRIGIFRVERKTVEGLRFKGLGNLGA